MIKYFCDTCGKEYGNAKSLKVLKWKMTTMLGLLTSKEEKADEYHICSNCGRLIDFDLLLLSIKATMKKRKESKHV